MRLLETTHYSDSVVYAHKKCLHDFKDYLQRTHTAYSFEAGLSWLETHKRIWEHSKYKANRLVIYQLNDMFNTGKISAHYVYENSPNYKRLQDWCRIALDRYLEGERLSYGLKYVNIKRIACSHFLYYLCANEIKDFEEITCHSIIAYHSQANHTSQKSRDHYEAIVRDFLEYLHQEIGLPLSLSFLLNKFFVPYMVFLENLTKAERERFIQAAATGNNTLSVMDYLKMSDDLVNDVFPRHKYSHTIIKTFRKVYRLFFVFLEIHHFSYSAKLAEVWLSQNKSAFSSQWKSYRRALFLFEQHLKNGVLIPELMYSSRQDPLLDFPDWCRKPLQAYVTLRKKENRADSTLAMIRASCMLFLRFLLTQHISSFDTITPDLVARFNREDIHRTADGKNAYNIRIRMFLEYLSEVGLAASSLYMAVSCVSAPKTRIISILEDAEITEIQNYCTQGGSPMRLRNRAMVLLGLKMGLRSSDIVNLKLSDISWQNSSLSIIQEKTNTGLILPMPISVANSIYRYIMQGRPETKSPFIFIHHRVPYKRLNRAACRRSLNTIIEHSDKRSGRGFHVTRKTFASKLLAAGTPVNLIVDSLGHQSDSTVSKYLALDEQNLRCCAISLAAAKISLKEGVRL